MANENVRIFLFHRIGTEIDFPGNYTSPKLFEQFLGFLSKNYSVISLESYFFRERLKLAKQPVILTFDGNYKSILEYGLPLLQKYKMPATIFVSAECLEHDVPLWNHLMEYIFSMTAKLKLDDPQPNTGFLIKTKWESHKARINYSDYLINNLQSLAYKERWQVIHYYLAQFKDVTLPDNLMMNWADLKTVKDAGLEIGAHIIMDTFPETSKEENQLDFDLRNSAALIRDHLGSTPSAVSFNTQRNNSRIKNLIHHSGFKLGLAVGQNIYVHGKFGRYTLPRIEIYNESFFRTKLRVNGTISRLRSLAGI